MRHAINGYFFLCFLSLGENFDRQASFRRSIANTDTIIRRPKRVQRRKTITGVPDNIQTELGIVLFIVLYYTSPLLTK